jgi:acetyl-CoA synthetase
MEDQYQALYTTFRWWVPQRFNIADACCRRWTATSADARRIALYAENMHGEREVWTFARLHEYANRLSNGLRRMGVQRGDRVAIALPQRPEAAVAHIAVYQLGAITVPLSTRLPGDVVEQRLRDSESRIVLVDGMAAETVLPAADRCPLLRQAIGIDLDDERVLSWRTLIARQESVFDIHPTGANDPAILLYKTGTTGPARGVVLSHGSLIGNLPGVVASQDWFPQPTDVLWTASEWGGGHGLFDGLLPALYFGQPLVASRHASTPEQVFELLERYQVTNASLQPAALRGLLDAVPDAATRYKLSLRAMAVGGAHLDAALAARCEQELGVVPNETYGQAEVRAIIGHSRDKWPSRPGSMGRPYPGHQVAIATPQGHPAPPGTVGEIVVNRYDIQGHADPALFLGYWRGEEAGRPVSGTWHHTGDLARVDDDGYFWYAGRIEDVFLVDGGHTVVPDEVEAVLRGCPGIEEVAIVPSAGLGTNPGSSASAGSASAGSAGAGSDGADSVNRRLPAVKAYVTRRMAGNEGGDAGRDDDDFAQALRDYASQHLPAWQVPADVEIMTALPMTVNGTVRRMALRFREEESARRRLPAQAPTVPAP